MSSERATIKSIGAHHSVFNGNCLRGFCGGAFFCSSTAFVALAADVIVAGAVAFCVLAAVAASGAVVASIGFFAFAADFVSTLVASIGFGVDEALQKQFELHTTVNRQSSRV